MRVTAVVVNFNGADQLAGCLESLLAQDHPLEVVVVDNASTDSSAAVLDRYRDRVRVIRNPTNRGFAGGVNVGLAATDSDAVLVTNFDVRLAPDYLRHAVAALAADPRRGAVQGKLLRPVRAPDGSPVIDTTGHVAFRTRLFRNRGEGEADRGQYDQPGEVFGVSGAVALYRRAMLEDVAVDGEVFDEDLFAYFEDVDLDWRAQLRGWVAWYEPRAVGEHERGGAGPRRTRLVEALNWSNRLLVLAKCDRLAWRDVPGVVVTTVLKTTELALTVPLALLVALGRLRLLGRMRRKRRLIMASARVDPEQVIARWFGPFDYRAWVRTWWRRIRGAPLGV